MVFQQWEDSVNEKYPHVVHEELCKACDAEHGHPIPVEVDSLENVEGYCKFCLLKSLF